MPRSPDPLDLCLLKMKEKGLPASARESFAFYHRQASRGETGLIPERDISPVPPHEITRAEDLKGFRDSGRRAVKKSAAIILNGGIGTGMGLSCPKSLVPVKDGRSFLEIIIARAQKDPARLVLMNSFRTHEQTRRALARMNPPTPPGMFVQRQFPKILAENHQPARWQADPEMEWNPPGHGDLYMALYSSGMLESLLKQGVAYAFVSNADNVGASLDPDLLGYFAEKSLPFMMEAAERTRRDSKGGHIARDTNGALILRESSQVPEQDRIWFSDIKRHRFFNTNNLWINLEFLREFIQKNKMIRLPLILNPKPVCPKDPDSPPVHQIETAAGSAISLFEGARALRVPRSRFRPVKTCGDLLALRSDRFFFKKNGLVPSPGAQNSPIEINLDPRHYGNLDSFEKRFSKGVPSLAACRSLEVEGDVFFEKGVTLKGHVAIRNRSGKPAAVRGVVADREIVFD
ncbi:conserved hypothetical protein [Candidatus Desulfarcum epimagneticum]|uniref:UTP--glucose-1-phosphate uridylyltransferase n=1 Tax=uncultured Desulfobacteraceae bacterium TaxID=218296 RepID=A0A484HEF8_9BACT|nr:conserved hypothetical protein [uncultured Desulfobacteraceae bacterium]